MLFNKVFRFISIILLFTNVSGWREPPPHTFGKQYRGSQHSGSQHRDSLKPQPFKHINLSRLRNIDLQKISSHFNSSVPAATLGLQWLRGLSIPSYSTQSEPLPMFSTARKGELK